MLVDAGQRFDLCPPLGHGPGQRGAPESELWASSSSISQASVLANPAAARVTSDSGTRIMGEQLSRQPLSFRRPMRSASQTRLCVGDAGGCLGHGSIGDQLPLPADLRYEAGEFGILGSSQVLDHRFEPAEGGRGAGDRSDRWKPGSFPSIVAGTCGAIEPQALPVLLQCVRDGLWRQPCPGPDASGPEASGAGAPSVGHRNHSSVLSGASR
jgi:hypothetical protein